MPSSGAAGHGGEAQRLTDAVTRLRRALRASIRTDIAWETLPMAQVEVLQLLAERSPARVSDVATLLHLAPSTASGLVGQMMGGGLVERSVDPADRRAAVVTLAAEGEHQLAEWHRANERRIGAALAALPARERDAVVAAIPGLARLAELLAVPDGSGPPQ